MWSRNLPVVIIGAGVGGLTLAHPGLGESLARVSTEPTRLIHRDGRDGHQIRATRGPQWYRDTFGAPFFGRAGSGPGRCS